MVWLLVPSAVAGPPARCVATWTAPAPACELHGTLTATATAGSEAAARRGVTKELEKLLDLEAAAQAALTPLAPAARFSACHDAAETANVSCFPEPTLADTALCFVQLDDSDCWTGDVLHLETVGWRALDAGRRQMCDAVDKHLVEQAYSDVESRRVQCRAKCEAETTVRCPSDG